MKPTFNNGQFYTQRSVPLQKMDLIHAYPSYCAILHCAGHAPPTWTWSPTSAGFPAITQGGSLGQFQAWEVGAKVSPAGLTSYCRHTLPTAQLTVPVTPRPPGLLPWPWTCNWSSTAAGFPASTQGGRPGPASLLAR